MRSSDNDLFILTIGIQRITKLQVYHQNIFCARILRDWTQVMILPNFRGSVFLVEVQKVVKKLSDHARSQQNLSHSCTLPRKASLFTHGPARFVIFLSRSCPLTRNFFQSRTYLCFLIPLTENFSRYIYTKSLMFKLSSIYT